MTLCRSHSTQITKLCDRALSLAQFVPKFEVKPNTLFNWNPEYTWVLELLPSSSSSGSHFSFSILDFHMALGISRLGFAIKIRFLWVSTKISFCCTGLCKCRSALFQDPCVFWHWFCISYGYTKHWVCVFWDI